MGKRKQNPIPFHSIRNLCVIQIEIFNSAIRPIISCLDYCNSLITLSFFFLESLVYS